MAGALEVFACIVPRLPPFGSRETKALNQKADSWQQPILVRRVGVRLGEMRTAKVIQTSVKKGRSIGDVSPPRSM